MTVNIWVQISAIVIEARDKMDKSNKGGPMPHNLQAIAQS